MSILKYTKKTMPPPKWLALLILVISVIFISCIIGSDVIAYLSSVSEGFHNFTASYYPHYLPYNKYPYPPPYHDYIYSEPYPPPNPHLYPWYYTNHGPGYGHGYGPGYGHGYSYGHNHLWDNSVPRYNPYNAVDLRQPVPVGYTEAYYYDRYRRLAEANKANNPHKYHYDAEGDLIDSEEALYYDHQPWNQPSRPTWGRGWLW